MSGHERSINEHTLGKHSVGTTPSCQLRLHQAIRSSTKGGPATGALATGPRVCLLQSLQSYQRRTFLKRRLPATPEASQRKSFRSRPALWTGGGLRTQTLPDVDLSSKLRCSLPKSESQKAVRANSRSHSAVPADPWLDTHSAVGLHRRGCGAGRPGNLSDIHSQRSFFSRGNTYQYKKARYFLGVYIERGRRSCSLDLCKICHAEAPTEDEVLGATSIIVWALTLIVIVKYQLFALRLDDHGEGKWEAS